MIIGNYCLYKYNEFFTCCALKIYKITILYFDFVILNYFL